MAQGKETWSPPKEFEGGLIVDDLTVTGVLVLGAEITLAAAGGGAQTASVQFNDGSGVEKAVPCAVPFYLASDAAGLTPSSAPDGGIAAGTDGALIEWTANVAGLAISEADGDLDVVVTESGSASFFLVLVMPGGGLVISAAIQPTP